MEKLKLTGIGSKDNVPYFGTYRSYFKIKKDKNLIGLLAYLLLKCDFDDNPYLNDYQIENKQIEKFVDCEDNYTNTNFDIDIIFGDKEIILVVRTKTEKHKQFVNSIIDKYCEVSKR